METEKPIRILFVEDVPADAEIAARELQKGGIQFTSAVVDTKEAFVKALEEFQPDIIISDYAMPEFDGMLALKLAKENAAIIPFIMLTGSINEETAVTCMKAGATDYVLKDRMKRLPFAVREALEQQKIRLDKDTARLSLRESEERFRTLIESAPEAILVQSEGFFVYLNPATLKLLGASSPEQLLGKEFLKQIAPKYHEAVRERIRMQRETGKPVPLMEQEYMRLDGSRVPVETTATAIRFQGRDAHLVFIRDITERKRAEDALRSSEEKFRHLFDQAADLIAMLDLRGNFIDLNRKFEEESRWSREEIIGRNVLTSGVVTEESVRNISFYLNQMIQGKEIPMFEIEGVIKDGGTVPYEIRATHIKKDDKTVAIQAILRNITERKQAIEVIEALRKQNLQVLQSAGEGILGLDKEGKHTFVNPSAAKMLGYTPDELIGADSHSAWHNKKRNGTYYPEDQCPIHKSLKNGTIHTVDNELFWRKNGTSFPVEYTSTPIEENGKIIGAVVTFKDITERRQMEAEIEKRVEDLQDFYEMAIGRELRMKELKEEISELKKRLVKYEKVDD